ncbi:hypothetical protein KFE25_002981 [Diacronema lutheri]|uniref:Uncharacterized protein n=1 Tax=Diacronema lutheri TaxID=2081491 RepID=A0A8J5XLX9_DIALT|nr:hypothetical protein KFE25_002981 [Diacronema lutheri]
MQLNAAPAVEEPAPTDVTSPTAAAAVKIDTPSAAPASDAAPAAAPTVDIAMTDKPPPTEPATPTPAHPASDGETPLAEKCAKATIDGTPESKANLTTALRSLDNDVPADMSGTPAPAVGIKPMHVDTPALHSDETSPCGKRKAEDEVDGAQPAKAKTPEKATVEEVA